MASPDVIGPALLLPIPVVSLALSVYNWLFYRSSSTKGAVFVLLAILAAVAGGTALSVACGAPLRAVSKVFTTLLHTALSTIVIYSLNPSSHSPVFPPLLRFCLLLAALLVACELVSALIPTSPFLLPTTLALVSRVILLALAVVTAIILHRRHSTKLKETNTEKGQPIDETPGRVSSPTPGTWPFPGSLTLQGQSKHGISPPIEPPPPDLLPSSANAHMHNVYIIDRKNIIFLPLSVAFAQIFAILSAALDVAASAIMDTAIKSSRSLSRILLASAACTLIWCLIVLAIIQMLPTRHRQYFSERHGTLEDGRDNPQPRTRKSSLSRRESDSFLDFLSLRDPFASSPPQPPPLPPTGLGLDEVNVGWNGNKEIGVQYRFAAPRSVVKGGRRKGKKARVKLLAHQDSTRTLLPLPETRSTEADVEREKGFRDEARLAQLLLQSLGEDEDCGTPSPDTPTPVPAIQPPEAAHVQQSSRWSTSTTVRSIVSGSVSNRSGVSTYTTCVSEKVPTSRISMNTITSVLGSRKSSEAKRKSALTASSSKG